MNQPDWTQSALPLVSIIIPCYNCSEYIEEAIQSALCQAYPNIEIIIINDGSTDRSADLISKYPVRYFHLQHMGVSYARNYGAEESRGEYIVFLDSDDRLTKDGILLGFTSLSQHPECCMSVGSHNIVSSRGTFLRRCNKYVGCGDYYSLLLRNNFIECTSSALFRRDPISRGDKFDVALRVAEDYDLYLRLGRKYPVVCHPGVVSDYRVHQNNASHKSALMLTSTLRVINSQYRYVFTNFARIRHYIYGSWFWRRKYGRQLTRELATKRGEKKYDIKQWCALLCSYPIGVPIALILRALPQKVASSLLPHLDHSYI